MQRRPPAAPGDVCHVHGDRLSPDGICSTCDAGVEAFVREQQRKVYDGGATAPMSAREEELRQEVRAMGDEVERLQARAQRAKREAFEEAARVAGEVERGTRWATSIADAIRAKAEEG